MVKIDSNLKTNIYRNSIYKLKTKHIKGGPKARPFIEQHRTDSYTYKTSRKLK
jgi:hypothetical protein